MQYSLNFTNAMLAMELKGLQKEYWGWLPDYETSMDTRHVLAMEDFLNSYKSDFFETFIKNATTNDFEQILKDVFTSKVWPSFKRAFFTALHVYAVQCEVKGTKVSKDFATFYRQHYTPPHIFEAERS
jgi:hypothetical protein